MTAAVELRMPLGCVEMDAEEMEYMEGGARVRVNGHMCSKSYCYGIANRYKTRSLSRLRVAMEIYAHAYVYRLTAKQLPGLSRRLGIRSSVINYLRTHSNPIDIGGDSLARVAAYKLIWNYC